MPPLQNEPTVYEETKNSPLGKIIIIFIIGGSVLLGAGFILSQSGKKITEPTPQDDELALQAEIARIKAEAEGRPFVFTAVPEALSQISLPPPPVSSENDAVVYNKLKATTTIAKSVAQNDVVFNLAPMGITYLDYINNFDDPTEIFQLTDELHQLTLYFNELYKRPPLTERVPGVVQMAPLDPIIADKEIKSVYPSIRAVDAFLALEIMIRLDPLNANIYEASARELINRGIGYGLYGQSDVDAAQSLVTQYMNLYTLASTTVTTDNF